MYKSELAFITKMDDPEINLKPLRMLVEKIERLETGDPLAALLKSVAAMIHAKYIVEQFNTNIRAMEETLRGRLNKIGLDESALGIPRSRRKNLDAKAVVRAHVSAGML